MSRPKRLTAVLGLAAGAVGLLLALAQAFSLYQQHQISATVHDPTIGLEHAHGMSHDGAGGQPQLEIIRLQLDLVLVEVEKNRELLEEITSP